MLRYVISLILLTGCGFSGSKCQENCGTSEDTQEEPPINNINIPIAGPKGDSGKDGTSCNVTTVSTGALITCGGTSTLIKNGLDGNSGLNGKDGVDGKNGIDGKDGQDLTPITMVKFCPKVADQYPSVFVERGFCIDNKIYAVFWSGSNAFLTYLTPGNYITTSINTNCNFTVKADTCAITNY